MFCNIHIFQLQIMTSKTINSIKQCFKKFLWGEINATSPITVYLWGPAKRITSALPGSRACHVQPHLPRKWLPQSHPVELPKLWAVISFDCAASICHDKFSTLSVKRIHTVLWSRLGLISHPPSSSNTFSNKHK